MANNPEAKSSNGDVYIVDSQTGGKKHKIVAKNTSGTKKKRTRSIISSAKDTWTAKER